METLIQKHCVPCEGGTKPFDSEAIEHHLKQLPGWALESGGIERTFQFKNYYETISFVNATAWISNQEDHHPDLTVGYKQCKVRYQTHAAHGLTENDFICAAKVSALLTTSH